MTCSVAAHFPGLRYQEHKLLLTIGQMLCWGVNDTSERLANHTSGWGRCKIDRGLWDSGRKRWWKENRVKPQVGLTYKTTVSIAAPSKHTALVAVWVSWMRNLFRWLWGQDWSRSFSLFGAKPHAGKHPQIRVYATSCPIRQLCQEKNAVPGISACVPAVD